MGALHVRVVLVLMDLVGQLVLLLLESRFVGRGQMAVVHLPHVSLFLVQIRLFTLDVAGFSLRQTAAIDAIGNAVLLVDLSLSNRFWMRTGSRRGGGGLD